MMMMMYALIRSISAGVSEIIRFDCSNSLWIVKFIPGNECAVTVSVSVSVLVLVLVIFTSITLVHISIIVFFPLCFT